jgi:hypothetical protein
MTNQEKLSNAIAAKQALLRECQGLLIRVRAREQREKVRSGFNSQLHSLILNKNSYFTAIALLKGVNEQSYRKLRAWL